MCEHHSCYIELTADRPTTKFSENTIITKHHNYAVVYMSYLINMNQTFYRISQLTKRHWLLR